jgi:F-type H+-transporting ATPase subunit a
MIGIAGRLLWIYAWANGASPDPVAQAAGQDVNAAWNEHMMAEVSDAHHLLIPFINREIALPQWPPLHVGSFSVDLSPSKHVVYVIVAALLCAATMIWVARKTHGKGAERAPKGLANVIEAFVIYLRDEVAMRNIGKGGERYVPFILTLFFFILYMNLLGLVPFGASATGNVGVTAALAVLSLVAIEVGGLLHIGPKAYLRTIVYIPKGLNWFWSIVMAIIMTPVELVAKLARIFALSIRLFANMIAGHLVILSLVGLIFVAGAAEGVIKYVVWPAPVLMAVAIMMMEIFIALLQAYIFAILTSVFIGLVRHPH